MKQANLPEDAVVIKVDYTSDGLPEPVRKFRPVVYQDKDVYCCVLGEDATMGIFGTGDTPEEAITDWVLAFQKRINEPAKQDDEVLQYIKANQ